MTMGLYEDDDNDVLSSIDSHQKKKAKLESNRKMKKKEIKRKLNEWVKSERRLTGLLDTTGASILEVDGHKLKLSKPGLFDRLTSCLWLCRWKNCLSYFTHPGGENFEGGMVAIENSPGLIRHEDEQLYVSRSCIAIQQYNDNNQQSSKLEFISFIRVAFTFGYHLYITFTACQNGQLGTYQAVVDDDWLGDGDVYLVLLRHVEAEQIIAIMSLSGAEEEWEKLYGKDWKLCAY
ncbi:hypothetical protein RND81_05G018100 [Saponaria officinalis]|uniref:Uncharacterized protein n=1 Tax=Saponaria officinalis TaxID=3572 RepID=A0AAW1KSX2_SAPOF